MQDWQRKLIEVMPATTDEPSEHDWSPFIALASEAGRQATWWQATARQQERLIRVLGELANVRLNGELPASETERLREDLQEQQRAEADLRVRIADLQSRLIEKEGQIEDLHGLLDRLLERLSALAQACPVVREPHDSPGDGHPVQKKDKFGVPLPDTEV